MSDPIAFTLEYQGQILSQMLYDPEFKFAVRDHVSAENFGNHALGWFFEKLSDPDINHTKLTLKEELVAAAKNGTIKSDDLDSYMDIYRSFRNPIPAESEHIRNTVSQFIKTQSVKLALMDSLDLVKTGNRWDEIAERMTLACAAGLNVADGGHRYLSQHKERLLARANKDISFKIPVGIPEVDELLNGGIEEAQLGLVAGATGRGKSLFLQWMAKTALLLGKKVVYFTLELSESKIAERFDSMLAGVKFSDIDYHSETIAETMVSLQAKCGDSLVIKGYPADTATVHTLKSFLMRLAAVGFIPDLIIVDYLDLMKPHRTYKSSLEEVDAMTKALRGLAESQKTRIWTASQLNRAGIVMENPDETAMGGSITKLYTCDICIYMAQTKEEKLVDIMRLVLMKNRNGLVMRQFKITQDYSYMTFYKEAIESGLTNNEETQDSNNIGDGEAFLD